MSVRPRMRYSTWSWRGGICLFSSCLRAWLTKQCTCTTVRQCCNATVGPWDPRGCKCTAGVKSPKYACRVSWYSVGGTWMKALVRCTCSLIPFVSEPLAAILYSSPPGEDSRSCPNVSQDQFEYSAIQTQRRTLKESSSNSQIEPFQYRRLISVSILKFQL